MLWLEGIGSLVQDSFRFLYPEFGTKFAPICSRRPLFQNWFSLPLFPLTEEGGYFRFRILANHLASIFFLPLSGDSLGLLSLSLKTTQSHTQKSPRHSHTHTHTEEKGLLVKPKTSPTREHTRTKRFTYQISKQTKVNTLSENRRITPI